MPSDQRRPNPLQMRGLSLGLRLQSVSAGSGAGQGDVILTSSMYFDFINDGQHEQAKRRALSSRGHIFGRKEAKRSMMRFAKIEKIAATVAVGAFALVSLLSTTTSARAQDSERPYPKMLPLSQYLMDRNAAIALARSAAPEGISKDASVLVLTFQGWETAVKGTNGFVCMAGPSWTASIDFYDVWSPKQRGAICLNPPAVRSILPIYRKLTEMTLAGVTSVKERIAGIQEAYAKQEIPPVEPGAMSFMMSKDAYLTDFGQFTQFMPRDVFLADERSC
jgi:hypothetical protein